MSEIALGVAFATGFGAGRHRFMLAPDQETASIAIARRRCTNRHRGFETRCADL